MTESEKQPRSLPQVGQLGLKYMGPRRRPGRGIGEKRVTKQVLTRLDTVFTDLRQMYEFLKNEGHLIINESGSLQSSQAHQNLNLLLELLEDFLYILNCAIGRHGGVPKLV